VTNIDLPAEGSVPVYQVALPVSRQTLTLVGGALRTYRQRVKSRWRKLPNLTATLLVLAVLRHDQRPADLAAANGVSHDTVHRWVEQVIGVLAEQAPRLDRVLATFARTRKRGQPGVLLLDGTCLPVHEPAGSSRQRKRFWCAKHKARHVRIITLTDQHGRLLWNSPAVPAGAVHETTQAKRLHLPARLRKLNADGADLVLICDRLHTRLDDDRTDPTVLTGRRASRNHKLTPAETAANTLLAAERATNEHAHAHLKNWRILTRLRHGWRRHATNLTRALLVLTDAEINR
jgi:hypothetical protein